MKKHPILLLLLILGFTFQVTAQEINSLLWKVSGNNAKSDSYILFGTGGICDLNPILLSRMKAISNNIKVYYTETALGNKKYEDESKKFVMIKDKNEAINKHLADKSYQVLKTKMAGRQINENQLNQFGPLLVFNLLLNQASPECGTPNYLETVMKKYAEQYGVEVKELLNIQEAYDLLNSYGNAYYVNEIEDLLNNEEAIKSDLISKSALYQSEDITGLKVLYAKSRFLNSKFSNDQIAGKRIKDIADKMDPVVKDGGALITLDLGNIMDNKNNILSELKNRGYVLTTVAQ